MDSDCCGTQQLHSYVDVFLFLCQNTVSILGNQNCQVLDDSTDCSVLYWNSLYNSVTLYGYELRFTSIAGLGCLYSVVRSGTDRLVCELCLQKVQKEQIDKHCYEYVYAAQRYLPLS